MNSLIANLSLGNTVHAGIPLKWLAEEIAKLRFPSVELLGVARP